MESPGSLAPEAAIQDYGIIGDCRSAALVSRKRSIDWLCWPRFDKPSIVAAILGRVRGGYWLISPTSPVKLERQYVPDSNILQNRFFADGGTAVLTDLMPVASEHESRLLPDYEIIRRVECTAGELEMEIVFLPRAEYGLRPVKIRHVGKLGLRMEVGRGVYWLRGSVPLTVRDDQAYTRVSLRSGDTLRFSLCYSEEAPAVLPPLDHSIDDRIQQSVGNWQRWAGRADYEGAFRNEVVRSALALKLLTYVPSGAIIAAPTTSLPERIGGDLNWDYRYCWLRDAALPVSVFLAHAAFGAVLGSLYRLA